MLCMNRPARAHSATLQCCCSAEWLVQAEVMAVTQTEGIGLAWRKRILHRCWRVASRAVRAGLGCMGSGAVAYQGSCAPGQGVSAS